MAAVTPTQATTLTQDPVASDLIEQFPLPLSIAALFPFIKVDGASLRIASVTAQPPAVTLDGGATTADQTAAPVVNPFQMGYIYTRYALTFQAMDGFAYPNKQDSTQSKLAARRLLYGFFREFAGGTVVNPAYPGITGLWGFLSAHASQKQAAGTPGTFSISEFLDAYHLIKTNNGKPTVIMSTTAAKVKYLKALAAAGLDEKTTKISWLDPSRGRVTADVTAVAGTPWVINDAMADDDRIFFIVMGLGDSGTWSRGVTGIIPAGLRGHNGSMFVRRKLEGVSDVSAVGPPLVTDLYSEELISYSWPVGVAIGSPGAVSAYHGF